MDKADAIRQKRKQAIDLADEFLRSVFLDMFGDPVTNPKGGGGVTCKFEFSMISSLALLKLDYNRLTSEFLCMFLNHPRSKLVITANMAGAAITRLTLTKIKDIKVPLPSLEVQKEFSSVYQRTKHLVSKGATHQALAEDEFNSLSQKAFLGQL